MSIEQARLLEELDDSIRDVLELGFCHGVSTCYLAAIVGSRGGHVTAIDLADARDNEPNADQLLTTTGLSDAVTLHYEPTSYIWRLMKMLEESPEPRFDLCYIDGAHSWAVDGFAFFLADRLLRPGGWIVFDDLRWTYATSPALHDSMFVRELPEDERLTPQIQRVYELLVKPHPSYGEFRVVDDWAFARKLPSVTAADRQVVVETVVEKEGLGVAVESMLRRSKGFLNRVRRSR